MLILQIYFIEHCLLGYTFELAVAIARWCLLCNVLYIHIAQILCRKYGACFFDQSSLTIPANISQAPSTWWKLLP